MKQSEEADLQGLELARQQGKLMQRVVDYMAEVIADNGAEQEAGEYLVAYAIEKAEGLYRLTNTGLLWCEPETENVHIEVTVRDRSDGRFIPCLNVRVTVLDSDEAEIGTHHHPLLWHPYLYHYGRNWKIPKEGTYTIRVHIGVPGFPRHDEVNGKRFTTPVDAEFRSVQMKARSA